MNKRQKEVLQKSLKSEHQVLEKIEKNYQEALKEIQEKIKILQADEQTQSKIYQLEYQKALEKQINGILEKLKDNNFSTIQEYLKKCYEMGFFGTLYDIHGQGIPLIFPINQEEVVMAMRKTHDNIKLSDRLYDNIELLKDDVISEISRGISNGYSWQKMAQNLAFYSNISINRALIITRTEGHRVQNESQMATLRRAKNAGAESVKQWDSTLDGKTRKSHQKLDGQIREIEECFEVDGHKALYPGGFDVAKEDIQCRCAMLQRAKWALDEEELEVLQERARFFGLDKTKDLDEFKRKYLDISREQEAQQRYAARREEWKQSAEQSKPAFKTAETVEEAQKFAESKGVKYAVYENMPLEMANEFNQALMTIPEEIRPAFVGDSASLESYRGAKLPRNSNQFYGVHIDVPPDGLKLGRDDAGRMKYDFDVQGQMAGISKKFNSADKIAKSKRAEQKKYIEKHGNRWFFNEDGRSTPYHEIGHVYADAKGLPDGFERDAERWHRESKCDMLKNLVEAWSEAWGAYHTDNQELPDYIAKYIDDVTLVKHSSIAKAIDSGIMKLPRYKEAYIPKEKLTEYALNPAKDANKAEAFKKALGYTLENAGDLIEQIHTNLPQYNAIEKGDRGYGMTYEVVMDITGSNGKKAKVLTAWIDDKNNGQMRLTTVHVDK